MGGLQAAKQFGRDMQSLLLEAKRQLKAAQIRQEKWANLKRKDCEFQVGDKVLLSTKNLHLPGEQGGRGMRRKLLPRFVGPFDIIARVGKVAYELHLPKEMTCHKVFHVGVLRRYNSDPRWAVAPPPPVFWANKPEWEVERILACEEVVKGKPPKQWTQKWYKVRWKG